MLRFEGADGRLACWWECSFGRPIAMLSSSESEVDAVIISKDRRIFEFGTSTDTHLGASGFRDHLPERNESLAQCFGHTTQKIRCMAVEREASLHKVSDVTSFSLRQLANAKEKMQDLTSDGQGPTGKPQKKYIKHLAHDRISCTSALDDSCSILYGFDIIGFWESSQIRRSSAMSCTLDDV